MPSRSSRPPPLPHSRLTPRQSVEHECGRRGTAQVVTGCVELLAGGDADHSLVYALGGPAADSVLAALADESWRVREMAAKFVARQEIGEGLTAVAGLQHDPVPRVRAAAARATATLTAVRA